MSADPGCWGWHRDDDLHAEMVRRAASISTMTGMPMTAEVDLPALHAFANGLERDHHQAV
ncbi:hypothetical protein [Frankia sp. QA3]|uniref:hypothetical protein n=1 Tax=Frankia sp. QA3 TaxID=710111 RepID=UPI0012F81F33|nr:hypothetical protein [Frankia sp. QA3]